MSTTASLDELVADAADAFGLSGPPDRAALARFLDELILLLADGGSLDAETEEAVWHATRQLNPFVSGGEPPDAVRLAKIHAKLCAIAAKSAARRLEKPEREALAEDAALIEDFAAESLEHLETAEAGLLALEEQPDDAELLASIFRSFHTVKGMAGFLNLDEIGRLTHGAENLLDLARKGLVALTRHHADAVFQALDLLKQMIADLRAAAGSDGRIPEYPGVEELATRLQACAEGADAAAPFPETAEPGPAPGSGAAPPPGRKPLAPVDEKIKVGTERLDSLVNMVGELVIAQLMVAESLRAGTSGTEELLRNTRHQGKLIRELQELAMSMRMVPISAVFQKMARMARDLSKRSNKPVQLVVEGEQTELDRSLVDGLVDPLMHMIRNAVDHGIDPPEERRARGKPVPALIALRAYHAAGCIVIEIEDDGRGLDRDRLLEKALERGLFSPGQQPTDQEIFHTIFTPGLSTAATVTALSGRGVGMDVVRRNIDALRGRIDIASKPGAGILFTLTLPLTLAVIDGQIVRVGKERFVLPINHIRRTFRATPEAVSTVHGRHEMVLVRGELLPLVRLHTLFGIQPDSHAACDGLIVIVEGEGTACCLFVDDLLDQQQVVIKGLGPRLGQVPGVSGGAIMGDGRVRLILDVPGLIKLARTAA